MYTMDLESDYSGEYPEVNPKGYPDIGPGNMTDMMMSTTPLAEILNGSESGSPGMSTINCTSQIPTLQELMKGRTATRASKL